MHKEHDIFDKLISLPVLRIFKPFYHEHREGLLYIFFGGTAFFLNIFLFVLFRKKLLINELIANILCWIICVSFQFFTNRTWVFEAKNTTNKKFIQQIISFFAGRIFTLITEEIIIAIFITWLKFPDLPIKIFANIVVIILNYFISKLIVFKQSA